ncbi:MAG: serine/threonine protein kinase [Myxococcaceae bacterium]|nr:serine/threonine protein kinase [Myxococcaceae bacterium]
MSAEQRCGPYLLGSEIGRGGSGVVFAAVHEVTGQRVAIKRLLPHLSQSRQAVSRFFHEGRAAASVRDPGIVKVFDAGLAQNGDAFIAMELLEGESLAARLATTPQPAVAWLIQAGAEVARIVGCAHEQHLVHRDLKPENVFLTLEQSRSGVERVKVLDFGMAKLNPGAGPYSFVTAKGALLGTPMYMAPEQCRGGLVDSRADVYSLGCILYEMACGRPPFVGGGMGVILGAHVYDPVPPPRSLAPHIPESLARVIVRALAKDPEHRYPTMRELAGALLTLTELRHAAAR